MIEPGELEREHTLLTATARYDGLRAREALAGEDTAPGGDAPAAGEVAAGREAGGDRGDGAGPAARRTGSRRGRSFPKRNGQGSPCLRSRFERS